VVETQDPIPNPEKVPFLPKRRVKTQKSNTGDQHLTVKIAEDFH
jgi:hypothetical protein